MTIYTVKTGDTLNSIAREFQKSVASVAANNFIDPAVPLVPGQTLVILDPREVYTVKEGDTVLSIAESFSLPATRIWQNNPILGGKNNLYPGQTVVISYENEPNDDISLLGYAYTYIDDDLLRRTLPYLTYLSVFPYGLTDSGELIAPADDKRLIERAKEYNVIPLLSLTSLTGEGVFSSDLVNRILTDSSLRTKVIENTAAAVFEKGYGGVDTDFEFIDPTLSEEYALFVRDLKAALGESYTVFTDLAPKTYRDQPGLLYEAHDYSSLGTAADKLFLMTYEWGYMLGPPLAVSPIENVTAVVNYALSEIAPEKIFIGQPSYGYDWPLPFVSGRTRADSLSPARAVELARAKGADILYDSTASAPYFYYTENGTEHVVWFQDAKSVDAIASLAKETGVDGIGIWNIMRLFPQLWTVISSRFNIRKLI